MDVSYTLLLDLFGRSMALWWIILPGMVLGTIVGILPGFSAQNTLIILLPLLLYAPVHVLLRRFMPKPVR